MRVRTASHPRSVALSAAAVLALVGLSIFAGAGSASAAPDAVTITTPSGITTFGLINVAGTVAWSGTGGSVAVEVTNEANATTSFCTGSSYLSSDTAWSCTNVLLSMGVNTITARADDGAGTITSNTISFTVGGSADPTIDQNNVSAQGTSMTFTGTGPAMGIVDIWGYRTNTESPPGAPFCFEAPVNSSGLWTCEVTVPERDLWSFYASGRDILGNFTFDSATSLIDFVPGIPGIAVTATPTAITVDATTGTGGTGVGVHSIYYANSADAGAVAAHCPIGWALAGPFPSNATETCDLGTPLAGSYTVSGNSFTNAAFSTNSVHLIRIPNAPVLNGPTSNANATVTFTATVSPVWSSPFPTTDGGSIVTVETSTGVVICSGVPDALGFFSCTGASPGGLQTYQAHATSVGFGPDGMSFFTYHDGSSGFSNTQSLIAPLGQFATITSPSNGSSTLWASGPNLTISGTTALASPVDVSVNGAVPAVCDDIVPNAGSFSCTTTVMPGTYTLIASQANALDSAPVTTTLQASGTVTVPVPVPVPVTTPVAPTALVAEWSIDIGDSTQFSPGDPVVIRGISAPAGASIDAELHSTPVSLGTAAVNALGGFVINTAIPLDAEPGTHHIVVTATPADGGAPMELRKAITVVEPVAAPGVIQQPTVADGPAPAERQQPGAVSALTAGLVSPTEILSNPVALVTAGSVGLALVLLVLIPAEFFGEALASHYGSVGGLFARRKRLAAAADRARAWINENRFLAGAGLVFLTSVVFCFVDPGFGFDLTSLRLLLSCAASILLVNFLSAGITERVAEKAWKIPTRLEVMPWGLAIAVLAVLTSRLMNFSPGFLVGAIIGVSVIGAVSSKLESRVILLWSSVVWSIAIVAWVLTPLVPVLPATHPAAFFTALLADSLVATAAGGLTALVVALLPLALFDGGELFKNSKLRWAVAFGIAVASFCIVVLPRAGNWMGLGDALIPWLVATLAFIGAAIVTYLLALRRNSARRSRLLRSRNAA